MVAQNANDQTITIPHRAFTDRRLAGSHYRLIAAIAERIAGNGTTGVPQSELAAAAGVHSTTAPRLIADLVDWGYVTTTRSESDRRRLTYALVHGDTTNDSLEPARRAKDPTQQAEAAEIPPSQGEACDDPEPIATDGADAMASSSGEATVSPPSDTSEEIGAELPADWRRTMDRLAAAEEARERHKLPYIDLDREFDLFVQHSRGNGIRRPDWDAAWVEWAIAATPPPPEPKPAPAPSPARQRAQPRPTASISSEERSADADYSPF